MQRLTWHRADQSVDQTREYLLLALIDSGASIMLQDGEQNYIFITNLPDCWSVAPGTTPGDVGLFGDDLGGQLSDAKRRLLAPGDDMRLETTVGLRTFEFRVRASATRDGALHFLTTIVDLSEERRRELLLKALLREVSHRSKNLLAIIQSVAAQTARYTGTIDQFLQKFRGRLYSLSQSQDLITDSSWRGAYFFDLVRQQTQRFLPDGREKLAARGENLLLTPNASLHLGLALHELVVNSVSHGTLLSDKTGQVRISCTRIVHLGTELIEIVWNEPLMARDTISARELQQLKKHFGSTVLERVVPASVNGIAEYRISEEEIVYRLTFPVDAPG